MTGPFIFMVYSGSGYSNTIILFFSHSSINRCFAVFIGRSERKMPAALPRATEPRTGTIVYESTLRYFARYKLRIMNTDAITSIPISRRLVAFDSWLKLIFSSRAQLATAARNFCSSTGDEQMTRSLKLLL